MAAMWHPNRGGVSKRNAKIAFWLLALSLPTWLAALYFGLIAADQYQSEARFVVKSAISQNGPPGLSMLNILGLGPSQDDAYAVQDFITSREAIARLRPLLPLEEMYGAASADFLARFPSILYRNNEERFYAYFQNMVSVVHQAATGITTLKVRAFEPADARAIATALLEQGEALVNRMNERGRADALRSAQTELETAQHRLIAAQLAQTAFRNRELTIDPASNAVSLSELIGQLSSELAATRAQIREISTGPAGSPQLPGLRRKESALDQQIVQERARIGRDSGGLANRIAEFERLKLERDFAEKRVTVSEGELMRAREEAARQQLYLERVVEPNLPDYPTQPERLRLTVMVLFANLLALLIGWLVYSGVREHVAH